MPAIGEVTCWWPGSQIPSLRGLDEFPCRASEFKKKKKSKMLIFLVPTHSLTMNTNAIEISTSLQRRLTFKANAKGLKTHSRWNNIHTNREGLKTQKPSCFSRVGLRSHGPPACDRAWGTAVAPSLNESTSRGAEGACLKPRGPQGSAPFQVIGAVVKPVYSFSTRDWRRQGQRRARRRGKMRRKTQRMKKEKPEHDCRAKPCQWSAK